MTLPEFLETDWKTGKWVPIIEMVHDARYLLGFKRKSKRSRLSRVFFKLDFPINLDESTAAYEKLRAEINAKEAQSAGGADDHAHDALPATGAPDLGDGQ